MKDSTNSIIVTNVSKTFSYYENRTSSIKSLLIKLLTFQFNKTKQQKKTVLNNLTFSIKKGDFVGIMGKNGAGKSTFLKILSKIYKPNTGKVELHGKVVPLLELGAGFSPDLSGYENIYLNASILGFTKKEIQEKIGLIVEFSELNEHIYRPVKNYSSGMLVRLAFSIASHIEADILLFDEILAVGDVGFQKKCLDKINQLSSQNKTIILVTHSPDQIKEFCNRCIVFDNQGVLYDGPVNGGTECYSSLF
jgi:ABC-type polysaccharide/polyol phosphate transport system ATPase subunit